MAKSKKVKPFFTPFQAGYISAMNERAGLRIAAQMSRGAMMRRFMKNVKEDFK